MKIGRGVPEISRAPCQLEVEVHLEDMRAQQRMSQGVEAGPSAAAAAGGFELHGGLDRRHIAAELRILLNGLRRQCIYLGLHVGCNSVRAWVNTGEGLDENGVDGVEVVDGSLFVEPQHPVLESDEC